MPASKFDRAKWMHQYYLDHRDTILARSKTYIRKIRTPEQTRQYNLQAKYGLTLEEFGYLMERIDGICPCCGCELTLNQQGASSCHIDHDHKTGELRGLLCHSCNLALGYVNDSIAVLQKLIRYIGG